MKTQSWTCLFWKQALTCYFLWNWNRLGWVWRWKLFFMLDITMSSCFIDGIEIDLSRVWMWILFFMLDITMSSLFIDLIDVWEWSSNPFCLIQYCLNLLNSIYAFSAIDLLGIFLFYYFWIFTAIWCQVLWCFQVYEYE